MNISHALPRTLKTATALLSILLLNLITLPTSPGAAFIKLGDIKGEATDSEHKDWINLLAVDLDIQRPASTGEGQHRDLGPIELSDIRVLVPLDRSAAELAQAALSGETIPTVTIDLTATYGNEEQTYLTYKLKDVIVTSYGIKGRNNQNEGAVAVTLGYTEVEWTYIVRDPSGAELSRTTLNLGGQEGEE